MDAPAIVTNTCTEYWRNFQPCSTIVLCPNHSIHCQMQLQSSAHNCFLHARARDYNWTINQTSFVGSGLTALWASKNLPNTRWISVLVIFVSNVFTKFYDDIRHFLFEKSDIRKCGHVLHVWVGTLAPRTYLGWIKCCRIMCVHRNLVSCIINAL